MLKTVHFNTTYVVADIVYHFLEGNANVLLWRGRNISYTDTSFFNNVRLPVKEMKCSLFEC